MNKYKELLKELWQYAVFRWFVYQALVFVIGVNASVELNRTRGTRGSHGINPPDYATLFWILIFALPAVWVWRKPIWKLVKQALGFLNKKAE